MNIKQREKEITYNAIWHNERFTAVVHSPPRETRQTFVREAQRYLQLNELDVGALDFLEHLVLRQNFLQREGILVEDVVDGTGRNKLRDTTKPSERAKITNASALLLAHGRQLRHQKTGKNKVKWHQKRGTRVVGLLTHSFEMIAVPV